MFQRLIISGLGSASSSEHIHASIKSIYLLLDGCSSSGRGSWGSSSYISVIIVMIN
jgi:hypothetical protein